MKSVKKYTVAAAILLACLGSASATGYHNPFQGPKGDKGDTGAQGPKGEKGDRGATGATGAAGTNGINGKDGKDGLNGAKGDKGDKGDAGAKGADGKNGVNGADGLNGKDGLHGANGSDGANGQDGAKGDQGIQGANAPDAVTQEQMAGAVTATSTRTTAQINNLREEIHGVAKTAYSGVAAAMALQMPALNPYKPESLTMRLGVGAYKGQSAVGISFRKGNKAGDWSVSGGVSATGTGTAVALGIEHSF